MKKSTRRLILCFVSFGILCLATSAMATVETSRVAEKIRTAAVPFIANQGQVDEDVAFYARTLSGTLFVTHDGELVYNLPKIEVTEAEPGHKDKGVQYADGLVLREHLVNAKVNTITANREAVATVSYFRGNDAGKWQRGVTTFEELSLGKIYEGIELRLKAYGDNVEKLFYVSPGADPGVISLAISGADDLRVLDTGELQASSPLGNVSFTRPIAWQEKDGKRVPVPVAYTITANADEWSYAFQVGSYDKSAALIIDPLLASTYLGGTEYDYVSSIALDSAGNVYVTGSSGSADYPTTIGAYDQTLNVNHDIIISKLSPDLGTLLASTFLGGSSGEKARSITLDSAGNVYVVGGSDSPDYPTTAGAYDQTLKIGGCVPGIGCIYTGDIIISKLSPDLSTLLASTYLGGWNIDYAVSSTVDSAGNVYVTGYSESPSYPTTAGAYLEKYGGGGVISKLSSDLSALLASTFLGGADVTSITLDTADSVYVTGYTSSLSYPTTAGAYSRSSSGSYDIIVSKLSSDLSTLLASTYLGGVKYDQSRSIALDRIGNVYVTGYSRSSDYPTTAGAYSRTWSGGYDIVISRLSSDLSTLFASTYLGGFVDEGSYSIALDSADNVYVAGWSTSYNYPTTAGAFDRTWNGGGDIIISKLSPDLGVLLASTYLGGGEYDIARSIMLDHAGNVYVTGSSDSFNYPTTHGGYDRLWNGKNDIIISKLPPDLAVTPAKLYTPSPVMLLLKKSNK